MVPCCLYHVILRRDATARVLVFARDRVTSYITHTSTAAHAAEGSWRGDGLVDGLAVKRIPARPQRDLAAQPSLKRGRFCCSSSIHGGAGARRRRDAGRATDQRHPLSVERNILARLQRRARGEGRNREQGGRTGGGGWLTSGSSGAEQQIAPPVPLALRRARGARRQAAAAPEGGMNFSPQIR